MFHELKVIDCSTVLAGPSVGTFFAELGAQVLKFENPRIPDVTRSWKLASESPESAISAYFSSVNYNKQYKSLDLKSVQDLEFLKEQLLDADIFISNFKKGDDLKFGVTDAWLHSVNPSLIIGKITGFGDESDRVAYDLILQAETGFMSMNGTNDSGPVKMPVALIDVLAAHQLKEGILCALYERTNTNQGSSVSVSLYDAAVCSLANQASNFLMQNHIPQRIGSLHPNIAPYGELFETADKKTITFAIGSNKHFEFLCSFLGLNELSKDDKYIDNVDRVKNRTELQQLIQRAVEQHVSSSILEFMHANHVPCGLVRNLAEVFEDQASRTLIREEIIEGQLTKRVTQIAFKKNK